MSDPAVKVVLFFSEGISLEHWRQAGTIDRDLLLYKRLVIHGYETSFVTYSENCSQIPLPPGLSAYGKPKHMKNMIYGLLTSVFHRKILSNCDVIKSHQIDGSIYAVIAKLLYRKPLIVRCGYIPSVFKSKSRSTLKTKIRSYIEELLAFGIANVICVPSRAEARYIVERYRIDENKIRISPNWVDTEVFKPDPEAQKVSKRICFIGRFDSQKQPMALIEASKGIKNVDLLFIGGGPLGEEIRVKLKEYNLNGTVHDRLPNETLEKYLNTSIMYALPTAYEGGSPKTVLEAMACGIPVVCTNAFGADAVFQDRVHGLKFNPGDLQGFTRSILEILHDPIKASSYGKKGRAHVRESYSIESAIDRELNILERLCCRI